MQILRAILITASSILTVVSIVPYLRDVIKGKTKPRIVSWFTWALLTGIACAASSADHAYASATLLFFATVATGLVVILGFKHGDRKFERFDIVCQIGVVVGLVLWLLLNSPAIAILASIVIDLAGALPTLKHTWQKPYEETWVAFLIGCIGCACTVLAVTSWKVTALAYPVYLTTMDALFTVIILVRHRYVTAVEPAELRDL